MAKSKLESLLPYESSWNGWYGAPAPFGRTEFNLTIQMDYSDGSIKGIGSDKRGEFEIVGNISTVEDNNSENVFSFKFEKMYIDKSKGTGIYYEGKLYKKIKEDVEVIAMSGKYFYLYQMGFFKMNINEEFEMVLQ